MSAPDGSSLRVALSRAAGPPTEAFLRAFTEALPLLAWMNHGDGRPAFFNDRWYRYTGQDESYVEGERWMAALHPDDRPAVAAVRDAAIAAGAPYEVELRMRRHDGAYRWHAARVEPVCDAAGVVIAWAGGALDVDERRRLESELRESEQRFRAVQDASPDGSVLARAVRDARGEIVDLVFTYANAAASRILLDVPEPFVGRTMSEMFPDSVADGRFAIYARVIETGEPWLKDIYFHRRGVARGLRVTAVKVDDGVHIGFADLSERIRASAERDRLLEAERAAHADAEAARARAEVAQQVAETARREAEAASAVKGQFLATMSHELRTPLNAIGGYAQLLELGVHGPVTAEQVEALGRVQRSQQHLLGLINEVLNHAKLEAGAVQYDVAEVETLEIVREVEALVAPQARAKGLTLSVVDRCPGQLIVRADPEKARQVVLNLLSNAVKFTDAGGSVTVVCELARAEAHGDVRTPVMAAIRVVDTGRGIPADHRARVFEPFVQVGRRLASDESGTGLGLAISRDLARGMGGDLAVVSEEGVGSTFTFTLPLVRRDPDATAGGLA
jgi:PAS domain S-box-containing protein